MKNTIKNNTQPKERISPLEQLIAVHHLPEISEMTTNLPCKLRHLSLGCCE